MSAAPQPAPGPQAGTFPCPGCGAPLVVRAAGRSQAVACAYCGAVADAQSPAHELLSRYKAAVHEDPAIPLGTKGVLRGEKWECIGFMTRAVKYYGVEYRWGEYLLHNPLKGFRWLIESEGHWSLYEVLPEPPGGAGAQAP